ncbi:MAG: leucyl aminopeptidase [Alphaproteobacteria bacterium]
MDVKFVAHKLPAKGSVAVFVNSTAKLTGSGAELDDACGGALKKLIKMSDFKGAKGSICVLPLPAGTDYDHVLVVGMGKKGKITTAAMEIAGGRLLQRAKRLGVAEVPAILDEDQLDDVTIGAAAIGNGAVLADWSFDKYKGKSGSGGTKKKPGKELKSLRIATAKSVTARNHFKQMKAVSDGVCMTRDLVTEPANVLTPTEFANRCKELEELGVEVEVLDADKLKEMGAGAIMAVGQGSANPPCMVIMRWRGGEEGDAPLAFVGKGVTFDTGGVNIKMQMMEEMKMDMGGAGVVTGLMKAIAGRGAKVNVTGCIGLAENMPSAEAYRPSDILTSLSGKTIEVLNTDAEGRLVLADCLWHIKETEKPKFMIDLATLTGAMMIALGHEYAGFFTGSDKLAKQLHRMGKATGDKVWRLPLHDNYDRQIDSKIADVKNLGPRWAGATTAAQFLGRFVGSTPWAHIDIAGVTSVGKPSALQANGGATGFGVRLLDRMIAEYYED